MYIKLLKRYFLANHIFILIQMKNFKYYYSTYFNKYTSFYQNINIYYLIFKFKIIIILLYIFENKVINSKYFEAQLGI